MIVTPACARAIAAGSKTMIRSVASDPSAPCPHGAPGDRVPVSSRDGEPVLVEITSTRLERLQDISGEDLEAEGGFSPRDAFERWWDSVHARPGTRWNDNPWVWVITFRV